MSVPRGFGINGQALYSNVAKPIEINLQFTVTPSNGLGITSLKSNGYVNNVFMHTSTTPTSNNGMLNPNPSVGYALIQLKQNLNVFLGRFHTFTSATTGSIKIDNGATLTIGDAYIISTLGNATAAQWTLVGIPAGVTPAVGVSFIAIATGGGAGNTSTSRVSTPVPSGILTMEVVGSPTLSTNSNIASNAGEFVLVSFLAPTLTSTTIHNNPMIPTAPTTATVVSMTLLFDGSSVTVDGI